MNQWPDDLFGNAKRHWRSKNKIQHAQPCGCVVTTVRSHIVDITHCAEHQIAWDKASQDYADRVDQLIEDYIFGEKSTND